MVWLLRPFQLLRQVSNSVNKVCEDMVEQIVMQCNVWQRVAMCGSVWQCVAMQCNMWQCHSFPVQCRTAQFPVQCRTMWPDFLCHGCLRQFPSLRHQELTKNQNVPKCAINMSKRTKKQKHLPKFSNWVSSILNSPNPTPETFPYCCCFLLYLTNNNNKQTDW